ncbi:MAG: hypothetical protein OXE17_01165 [Chloroflexi bacterium]|nr:hypothetical protein [Chloroflexota bacterium]
MSSGEAAQILRRRYDEGWRTQQAWASIVLFCIPYADELSNLSFREVLEEAGISGNYANCQSLGAKLAGYVTVTRDFP